MVSSFKVGWPGLELSLVCWDSNPAGNLLDHSSTVCFKKSKVLTYFATAKKQYFSEN